VKNLSPNEISVKSDTVRVKSGPQALTEFLTEATTAPKGILGMSSPKPAFETIQFPEGRNQVTRQTNQKVRSDPDLLKPHQVADRLGVSERWVRDHATRRSPRIPALKLGTLLRFRATDIEKFLNENSVSTTSKEQSGGV